LLIIGQWGNCINYMAVKKNNEKTSGLA